MLVLGGTLYIKSTIIVVPPLTPEQEALKTRILNEVQNFKNQGYTNFKEMSWSGYLAYVQKAKQAALDAERRAPDQFPNPTYNDRYATTNSLDEFKSELVANYKNSHSVEFYYDSEGIWFVVAGPTTIRWKP